MDFESTAIKRYELLTERNGDLIIHHIQPSGTKETWQRQQEYIGKGGSGIVWLEFKKNETNQKRAVKQVRKPTGVDDHNRHLYGRELQALVELSAPKFRERFAEFYGWFQDETNICYAMEYFPQGDLNQYLANGIAEDAASQITHQILIGLAIMHKNSFTHRDLKPKNIFVVRQQPWWVKIGDFGISKHITGATALHTDLGTPGYAAPEMEGSDFGMRENFEYTNAVDMWSLGCVVHKMLTGEVPFSGRPSSEFYHNKVSFSTDPLRAKGVSSSARDFVQALIKRIPSDRLDVQAALKSRWIPTTNAKDLEELLKDDIPLPYVPRPSINPANQILAPLGRTPLVQFFKAAASGNNDAIKILRDQRIDINIKDVSGRTALHEAASHGQNLTIELLLKFPGIEKDVSDNEGNTPLLAAAWAAESTSLGILLDNGANPRAINNAGFCALHAAAKLSEARWTRTLLHESVPASLAENSNKMTPLHYAAAHGAVEVMDTLLDNDAELNLQDRKGWTALHYAARNNRGDCTRLLLKRGASLGTREGTCDHSPLCVAVLCDSTEVIRIILQHLAELNVQEQTLHSELCDAIRQNRVDVARWLINVGSNVNSTKESRGKIPLDWALQDGSMELVRMLIEEGLDISRLKVIPTQYEGARWGRYCTLRTYQEGISSLRIFLRVLDDLAKLGQRLTSKCLQILKFKNKKKGSGDFARLTDVVSKLTRIICAWNSDMRKIPVRELRHLGFFRYDGYSMLSKQRRDSCAEVLNDIMKKLEMNANFYSEDKNKIANLLQLSRTRNNAACKSIERLINDLQDLYALLSKSKMASRISGSIWGEIKSADEASEVSFSPNPPHLDHLDTGSSYPGGFLS